MNACPNKMLLQLIEFTRNKLLLYRAILIKDTNDQLRIISEHNEFFKALQKRVKIKAMEAIENHLQTDQSRYNLVVEE
jgi:DNA-binding GntR family transcriptional regulator